MCCIQRINNSFRLISKKRNRLQRSIDTSFFSLLLKQTNFKKFIEKFVSRMSILLLMPYTNAFATELNRDKKKMFIFPGIIRNGEKRFEYELNRLMTLTHRHEFHFDTLLSIMLLEWHPKRIEMNMRVRNGLSQSVVDKAHTKLLSAFITVISGPHVCSIFDLRRYKNFFLQFLSRDLIHNTNTIR